MKKSIACMLVCGALVASLGLVGCDNASKTEEANASAQGNAVSASDQTEGSATSATSEESAETTDTTGAQADEPEGESPFQAWYDRFAQEMESSRDSYIDTLERDYSDWPEGGEEALNSELDTEYRIMTENISYTYDNSVEQLQEIDGDDDERQTFIDNLAEVRDQCLAAVAQKIDDLRP